MATILEATEAGETIMLHIVTNDDHVTRQQIATFDMASDREHRFHRVVLQQFSSSSESKLISLDAGAMDALCDAWLARQDKVAVAAERKTDKAADVFGPANAALRKLYQS